MSAKKETPRPQDLTALEDTYRIDGELSARENVRGYLASRLADGADVLILVEDAPEGDAGNALTHFAADANLLATLSHRNLIPIHGGHWVGKQSFALVTDRCAAPSVATLVARGDSWGYPRIATILHEVNGLLEWARRQKVVHRTLTLDTIRIEPDTDRVLASFVAQPLTRQGAPGPEGDARTVATLAWSLLTRGRELPKTPEHSIGIVRPELPRRVVEATDALLHGQRVGETDPPSVLDFIALVGMIGPLMKGDVDAAELQAVVLEEQLVEREGWAAKEHDYTTRVADLEGTLSSEREAIASLEAQRAEDRERTAEERAELERAASAERDALETQLAAQREELEAQIAAQRAELESQIAALREEMEAQLASERAELGLQLASERTARATELAAERTAHEAALADAQARREAELGAVRQQTAAEREELVQRASAEREELERLVTSQRAELEAQLAEERTEHETRLAAALEARDAELTAARQQMAAEREELARQLADRQSEHAEQAVATRTEYEQQLAAATAQHQAQLEAAIAARDALMMEERQQMEAAIAARDALMMEERQQLAVEREQMTQRNAELEQQTLADRSEREAQMAADLAKREAQFAADLAARDSLMGEERQQLAQHRAELERQIRVEREQIAEERAALEEKFAAERAALLASVDESERALAEARTEFEVATRAQRAALEAQLAAEREAFDRALAEEREAFEAEKEGLATFHAAERADIEAERRALEELFLAYEAGGGTFEDERKSVRTPDSNNRFAPKLPSLLADMASMAVAQPVIEPEPAASEPDEGKRVKGKRSNRATPGR